MVSFHGVLGTRLPAQPGRVQASALVCTDPLAPPEQLADFGNTLHGFTNPAADGSMMRTALYDAQADRRSWAAMRSLFDEVLR